MADFLTTGQIAELAGVTVQTVLNNAERGDLACVVFTNLPGRNDMLIPVCRATSRWIDEMRHRAAIGAVGHAHKSRGRVERDQESVNS
jgi:hypothetical protein